MADFSVTQVALVGTGATQTGSAVKVTNCDKLSISFVITASAGSLNGTLVLTGTNDDARAIDGSAVLPTLTTGALIATGAGTITYATNAITLTNTAAGSYEAIVNYSSFPKWVRPVFTFGSGGGTMVTQVTISAWSTST